MERLQKKCIAGSLMTHCVLIGVLGLAAFTSQPTFKPLPQTFEKQLPMEVIPAKLIDGMTVIGGGGGKPAPTPPAKKQEEQPPVPAPQPPAPAPQSAPEPPAPAPPKVEKIPEPPKVAKPASSPVVDPLKAPDKTTKKQPKTKVVEKPVKDEDDAPVRKPTKTSEPKKVAVNLNAITRNNDDAEKRQKAEETRQRNEAAAAAQKALTERRNAIASIGKNLNRLDESLSGGGISIDLPPGPGYGQSFINYAQWVKEIYDRNWTVSDSVVGDEGIVRVEIVVQRNGAARGKILKSSGNAALDRTVQNALNRVSNIGYPFPEGSTDNIRTFIINFNLSSKRQTG